MANEFRSQSQMGGRVDYVKAGKPKFDLAAEAKKERAKMDGSSGSLQKPSPNKAPAKQAPKSKASPSIDRVGTKPMSVDSQMRLADEMEK